MVNIRAASDADLTAICGVQEHAFGGPQEARLVAMLHQAGKAVISLVAVRDGILVGSIVFSRVSIGGAPKELQALGLAPMAVLPELQRTGIGSELMDEGLKQCASAGYDAVVVLGDPRFYSRFGFSRASDYGLENEYGAQEEFMVAEPRAGALVGVEGLMQYAPEFRQAGC